jgi:hypothetical protein
MALGTPINSAVGNAASMSLVFFFFGAPNTAHITVGGEVMVSPIVVVVVVLLT